MASTLFTGASRYSQDFSAVIDRQVGIASLRLTQMQQGRTKSNDEVTALKAVNSKVTALQSTLQSIEDSFVKNAWQTTSSDATALKASSSNGVATGSYTVRVISLGSLATSVSQARATDPASGNFVTAGTTSLTLSVKNIDTDVTEDKTITISGTTLQDVADAINGTSGIDVKAALVNLGSTSHPNYALSLQGTRYGKFSLQLKEGTTDLMEIPGAADPSLGSAVEYKLNGTTVTSDSRSVTLAPKLTAELLKADATKDIIVGVSQGTSSFQTSINAFVTAYNAVLDTMNNYTGTDGSLVGNSLVSSVRQQMKTLITSVTGSGSLDSLAKIGLEFTREGRLSFNTTLFTSETKDKFSDLQSLIGTAATSGFMRTATDALKTIDDGKGNGILSGTVTALEASLKAEDSRIEAEQSRVEQFTKNLQERLAKADALIAGLEQQANYFNSMFEAMRANQKSMS